MTDAVPLIVVLATHNAGKVRELAALLGDLPVRLQSLLDYLAIGTLPEEGDSYAVNATGKALAVARATGQVALADDSGLEVDALGGEPGVHSSRWLGERATDAERNAAVLVRLRDVPPEARTARFRAVVAIALPEGTVRTFEGVVEGRIADRPAGGHGFGYDPIFFVPDFGRTMAELESDVKNRISHRAQALQAARAYLMTFAGGPLAPERFARWLDQYWHTDRHGRRYHYHPRRDAHSKLLAQLIWEDLYEHCSGIRRHFNSGLITYKINFPYRWPHTDKAKTIDLAIGTPHPANKLADVRIACELKAVMTEHKKAEPRIYDELSSSHQIVHASNPKVIAAGLTVVNIARTFVSPLRQDVAGSPPVSIHRQPDVTESMVGHLRGLRIRQSIDEIGFDAYCTFVIDCDNQGPVRLWAGPPAAHFGAPDHYGTFLERICEAYTVRFD